MAKVLLSIDDDDLTLALVRTALEITENWTILTANSAHDGLLKAETHRLDAILLDMVMPYTDGMATLQSLRLNPITQHIPVVFLTLYPETIAPLQQTKLGVHGIITKPIDPITLANQISHTLDWHR